MSKFKLQYTFGEESDYLNSKTTKTFNAETLDEVFFQITDFLRGVGYVFDGQIGIVGETETELCGESCDCQDTQLEFNLFKTNK